MSLNVITHVNFRGQAREALSFYHSVFGGELAVVTYGQAHDDRGGADEVIFGQVTADSGFSIMAYDVQSAWSFERGERSFYVSLSGHSEEEIRRCWDGLAAGATIEEPIGPAQWSPLYGKLTDRFGVTWIVALAVDQGA